VIVYHTIVRRLADRTLWYPSHPGAPADIGFYFRSLETPPPPRRFMRWLFRVPQYLVGDKVWKPSDGFEFDIVGKRWLWLPRRYI